MCGEEKHGKKRRFYKFLKKHKTTKSFFFFNRFSECIIYTYLKKQYFMNIKKKSIITLLMNKIILDSP